MFQPDRSPAGLSFRFDKGNPKKYRPDRGIPVQEEVKSLTEVPYLSSYGCELLHEHDVRRLEGPVLAVGQIERRVAGEAEAVDDELHRGERGVTADVQRRAGRVEQPADQVVAAPHHEAVGNRGVLPEADAVIGAIGGRAQVQHAGAGEIERLPGAVAGGVRG